MTRDFRRLLAASALLIGGANLLFGGATSVLAQARIEDCEKIQAADAYNQCLAKFGPTSKVKNVTPAQPGDVKGSGEEAAAGVAAKGPSAAPTSARGGRHASRGRAARGHRGSRHYATRGSGKRSGAKASGGRKRMTITVKRRR